CSASDFLLLEVCGSFLVTARNTESGPALASSPYQVLSTLCTKTPDSPPQPQHWPGKQKRVNDPRERNIHHGPVRMYASRKHNCRQQKSRRKQISDSFESGHVGNRNEEQD